MADIILKCLNCGKEITVSEHIAMATIPCSGCGNSVDVARQRVDVRTFRLKPTTELHRSEAPPPAEAPSITPFATKSQAREDRVARERRKAGMSAVKLKLSILLFLLLGGAMGCLRYVYAPGLPPHQLKALQEYGVMAIGLAYLVIVVLALKDNMFDGLLCLVVPFYPFYYLFIVSSAIFVRAVVAALLIGFGIDFGWHVQAFSLNLYHVVNNWIRNQ